MSSNKKESPTPQSAINALTNLLKDILSGLTVVELFAGRGTVSKQLLKAGAKTAVCVDIAPPDDHLKDDSMVWLQMDALQFLQEERVRNVGLIYSAPPPGEDYNRKLLKLLPDLDNIEDNCLVILEEPTWDHTPIQNYENYVLIENYEFGKTRVVVTQLQKKV
ncbi:MAG: RsmD family RNA methyltransferase [bacterium]